MKDPKYQHGSSADGWMEQNDTPRTDAAKVDKCGMTFVSLEFAQELERELKNAQEAYLKSVERDDYLTQELAASQAEVERLQTLPESRHKAFLDLLERAEKAEAEVAKLNHQLLKTESDLLQSQDINSFLDTEFRIACKRAEKAEAEAIQLKAQLKLTIK
jgi:hypothetical protein